MDAEEDIMGAQMADFSYNNGGQKGAQHCFRNIPRGGDPDEEDKTGDMTFCMGSYMKEAMKMMFMMRSHHMLTDVILEVGPELFHAHKVVLAAASPYFKAMFTGGLRECEMKRVKLQGVCPTAMAKIMYFMYTGQIRVTENTVCTLLPAATMFQVTNVMDACCQFLERQLDPTNAIGIANFAEHNGCKELYIKANQFIEQHFNQVCHEEEFLQLSAIQLVALIKRDELNVQEEREVYNAVLKWVRYDKDNRYPKMEHILHAVRCQYLTPKFLRDQMKNCDVLKKLPACREYLAQIFKDLTLHKKPCVKERTPNTPRVIYIAGGYLRHSLDVMEGFNADDRVWTPLARLKVPRSGLGGAFLKGMFYAVGGRNNSPGTSYDSDWVDRYNPATDQWRPCSPMGVPRNRVGVAVMDGLLYAVGGSVGCKYHDSVERFDPDEDRWTAVQPMHFKRLGVGVAVVNRLMYAVGGYDGVNRLSSAECYHPENNAWTTIASMAVKRSGAGVAALNQYLYVVGGYDGSTQLASVERYDTENDVWTHVAPVRIARSALSVTVLDDKLYAMGGYDGTSFLELVEVYDPSRDAWDEGVPLTSGRSGHASAVSYHQCQIHCDHHDHSLDHDRDRPSPSVPAKPPHSPAAGRDEAGQDCPTGRGGSETGRHSVTSLHDPTRRDSLNNHVPTSRDPNSQHVLTSQDSLTNHVSASQDVPTGPGAATCRPGPAADQRDVAQDSLPSQRDASGRPGSPDQRSQHSPAGQRDLRSPAGQRGDASQPNPTLQPGASQPNPILQPGASVSDPLINLPP